MTDEPGLDELERVAIDVACGAAAHVRARRPELFGPRPGHDPDAVGAPALAASGAAPAVTTKSTPTDPVTLADTETEHLIRSELRARRPDDEVLGEEAGGSVDVPSGVRWVVDPIDGTVNFMYGIPAYAVSVAAQVDGRSVAGAVIDVARGITYSAAAGRGAHLDAGDGRVPLKCNPIDQVDLALVATGFSYDSGRRAEQGSIVAELLPRIRDVRRVGAAALDLCMVASGAVDAHFEHGLSPWDWAAGGLIAAEAGAVVHTPPPDSRSSDGHVTVACAPGIADRFVRLLDDLGARRSIPSD
ncbi:inositol monophosphatase family protein [Gordonia sp. LSe1-13]|uniref:Inositol-1-monophosphatase n=1 Tax=Gordonia sesuvii TaxID=3116777 RepID=A0ABU7MBU5_9ACTN|nr:inositol monophosphatase family protein [Gordonia sp. LSe1-13]